MKKDRTFNIGNDKFTMDQDKSNLIDYNFRLDQILNNLKEALAFVEEIKTNTNTNIIQSFVKSAGTKQEVKKEDTKQIKEEPKPQTKKEDNKSSNNKKA